MEAIFGKDVQLLASGEKQDEKVPLPTKGVVGLYFSAHWCGPCRNFTPRLIENYKKIRANGKDFEVIFVSSDKGDAEFKDYYKSMPWMGLPYELRDLKAMLSKKYKVAGIPSLVLLDAETGKVITKDGRGALTKDSTGANYPWKPKPALELLGDKLVKTDGTEVKTADAIKDKYVGIYFSAHWCPPCKAFTPKLCDTYNKLQEAGKPVEFIFASEDQDEDEFQEYFKTMPFLSIPFDNREAVSELSGLFEVSGIPTFILLGPDGKVVQWDARTSVSSDPEGKEFPWVTKPVQDIETAAEQLNSTTCVVAFAEGVSEAEQKEIAAALEPIALEAQAKADKAEEDVDLICAIATQKDGDIGKRVRELCKIGDASDKAAMLILDLSDNGSYYVWDGSGKLDAAAAQDFVTKFQNNQLKQESLRE